VEAVDDELHGGVNRVWRVRTAAGAIGIHQLLGLPEGVEPVEGCARIQELEVAALRAGVRLPEPLSVPASGAAAVAVDGADGVFTAHRWYDAADVGPDAVSPAFARSLGESVGRLHGVRHPPDPLDGDVLERRPGHDEWVALGDAATGHGLAWGRALAASAGLLVDAVERLDEWEAASPADLVGSHRDLTSANLLDDHGRAVLIDWESAGPVLTSAELGRTALDNFLDGDLLDPPRLAAYLRGYAEQAAVPPIGRDWCALWIRGLVVFAEQCAASCLRGRGPAGLLAFQARVVEATPAELDHRLRLVDRYLDQFAAAVP
jgi:hypothetical protein